MVKRMKQGPVNAVAVLPAPLVKALQQVASGRHVYKPAVESPVARRWREARQFRQLGYSITDIAQQLEIEPRAVTRSLAAPSPPYSRAVAAASEDEHAGREAELRPHLADTHTANETETLLRTLIQWQRAMLITHIDAMERLGRRLRRLLRPDRVTPRRRRQDAGSSDATEFPLDWLAEFQAMRQRKDAEGTGV